MFTWKTTPEGYVEVDSGNGFERISHQESQTTKRVITWLPLALEASKKYNIPVNWILSIIHCESAGMPDISSPCCNGLMQIHAKVWNFPKEEAYIPEKNIDKGTQILSIYSKNGKLDLPATASCYNEGPDSKTGGPKPGDTQWGYKENLGSNYITCVVKSNNFYIKKLKEMEGQGNIIPEPQPYSLRQLLSAKLFPFAVGGFFGYKMFEKLIPSLAKKIKKD